MVNHKSFKRKRHKRRTYKKRSHRSFKKSFRRTKRTNKSRSRSRRKYNRKQRGGFDRNDVVNAIKSKPALATLTTAGTGILSGIYGGDAESALLGTAGGAVLSGLGYASSKAMQAKENNQGSEGAKLRSLHDARETSSLRVGGGEVVNVSQSLGESVSPQQRSTLKEMMEVSAHDAKMHDAKMQDQAKATWWPWAKRKSKDPTNPINVNPMTIDDDDSDESFWGTEGEKKIDGTVYASMDAANAGG